MRGGMEQHSTHPAVRVYLSREAGNC